MTDPSPLLHLPGAVAGNGIDAPVAAHYGSFNREQRALETGDGFVDLSHRDVVRISGQERLTWLHALTSQHLEELEPGIWTSGLVLSPQGHIEHVFTGVDDGEAFTAHTEPGTAAALIDFLERMKFMTRVEITDVTEELAVAWRPVPGSSSSPERGTSGGRIAAERTGSASDRGLTPVGKFDLVPRAQLPAYAEAAGPAAGLWAHEALRIARGEPRIGLDTDHRTIPNEIGVLGSHVHLDKGCYRGQETVARVHNLGKPPRRLTLLHLDGSENRLPTVGAELRLGEKVIGRVGSSARHHELGPIALALLKRNVAIDAQLDADGLAAAQEVVVDPEVGLHFRRH